MSTVLMPTQAVQRSYSYTEKCHVISTMNGISMLISTNRDMKKIALTVMDTIGTR